MKWTPLAAWPRSPPPSHSAPRQAPESCPDLRVARLHKAEIEPKSITSCADDRAVLKPVKGEGDLYRNDRDPNCVEGAPTATA